MIPHGRHRTSCQSLASWFVNVRIDDNNGPVAFSADLSRDALLTSVESDKLLDIHGCNPRLVDDQELN